MRKWLIPLLTALAVLLCAAAGAEGNVFRFEKKPNFVFEGETVQLALSREGDPAGGEVTFSSRNGSVASVDENGAVTGLAKGQTVITAVAKTEKKNYSAQITVTVGRKAEAVQVDEGALPVYGADDPAVAPLLSGEADGLRVLLLPVKKSLTLKVSVLPKDASSREVVLTSGDESVAKVQKNTVQGVSPGETVLTAASAQTPGAAVRYRVLVVQPVKKLTVEADASSVAVGGQITLRAAVSPADATVRTVRWSSGDEKTALVDENGVVTGVKAGNVRIIASASDGSGVRANHTVKVVQNPMEVTLSTEKLTVDVGRSAAVKAAVGPRNAFSKKVVWTSSDERVATVNQSGRITGVSVGRCTVTAASDVLGTVSASLEVEVQQPVKKVSFVGTEAFAYSGETLQLAWKTEPADATHPELAFSSGNPRVLEVDENGRVTAVGRGETYVNAVTTDGSRRKARIRVKVGLHVTGVEMVRKNAYLDRKETQTAGATIYPKDASNKNMTWTSSDESVVTVKGKTNSKIRLTSVNYGEATVTGVTEDGGYETSIRVHVGNYTRNVVFRDFDYDKDGNFFLSVRNNTDLTLTRITAEIEMYEWVDGSREPASVNTKDGGNKVECVWTGSLAPGETTGSRHWKMVNYRVPKGGVKSTSGTVTLTSFQIDSDWIKLIPESRRTTMSY